jgi:hypothetical protein
LQVYLESLRLDIGNAASMENPSFEAGADGIGGCGAREVRPPRFDRVSVIFNSVRAGASHAERRALASLFVD